MRSFVLDVSVYEGTANPKEATALAERLAQAITLPRAVVVDVGLIAGRGWSVIEFNAAWGAGLNGCRAERVLPAVLCASGIQSRVKT